MLGKVVANQPLFLKRKWKLQACPTAEFKRQAVLTQSGRTDGSIVSRMYLKKKL